MFGRFKRSQERLDRAVEKFGRIVKGFVGESDE